MATTRAAKVAAQYQGGLSDWVANDPGFIAYAARGAAPVMGYVGHRCRRNWLDAIVEEELRRAGCTVPEIVAWLTSTDGRHTGDSLEDCKAAERIETRRLVRRGFGNMKDRLQAWAHPSHGGMWSDTVRLLHQLFPWKYDTTGRVRPEYGGTGTPLKAAADWGIRHA